MFEKASVLLDCRTLYHIGRIRCNSDDENEMTNAAPVPMSSEIMNTMKSMRNYLDAYSIAVTNNKMDDIEQFVEKVEFFIRIQREYSACVEAGTIDLSVQELFFV
ncbi:hypothetical protein TNCV_4521531 [Trichonephila clavipes]|nr:hypothetical protein TNCV_4521531 [Trichonephila clavipes]